MVEEIKGQADEKILGRFHIICGFYLTALISLLYYFKQDSQSDKSGEKFGCFDTDKSMKIINILKIYSIIFILFTIMFGSIIIANAGSDSNNDTIIPITYISYIDPGYGFYKMRDVTTHKSAPFNINDRILTINPGDTVTWINDADTNQVLTIVSEQGLWSSESARLDSSKNRYNYTFTNSGKYTFYISEYAGRRLTIMINAIDGVPSYIPIPTQTPYPTNTVTPVNTVTTTINLPDAVTSIANPINSIPQIEDHDTQIPIENNLVTIIIVIGAIIIILGLVRSYLNSNPNKSAFGVEPNLPEKISLDNIKSNIPNESKTPVGITILGWLHFIGGLYLFILIGLFYLKPDSSRDQFGGLSGIELFGLFFLSSMISITGFGLLKKNLWSRKFYIGTYSILLAINLLSLPESIFFVITFAVILFYLFSNNVKLAFGGELESKSQKSKEYYENLLESANKYALSGKITSARKIYEGIIKDLENRQTVDSAETDLLGKSYFGLGIINLHEKDELSAFNNYKKAREFNHPLDENAIKLTGVFYVNERNKNKMAIEIYLEYIKTVESSTLDEGAKKIYSLLESICHIDENDNNLKRKEAIALNQKVININPDLDWAHYYLGLGHFIDGNFDEAMIYLSEAKKLNPNRDTTTYFLGKTYLKNGAIENALSAFYESLELNPNNADTSFHIGKILVDQLEGIHE